MVDKWPKVVVQLMHQAPHIHETLPPYHTVDNEMLVVIDAGDIVTDEALELLRANDRLET